MQFCNMSAYFSPVTLTVSKPESCISSKKKVPITVDMVNPPHTEIVVQWSLHETSGVFSSSNSADVEVDRLSKCETGFDGLQHVRQPVVIFRKFFEMPTSQMLSISQNRRAAVHDDAKFCPDSIGEYAVLLSK